MRRDDSPVGMVPWQRATGELLINDPDFGRGKKKRTLRDFDLEDTQSSRWQAIARIPEDDWLASSGRRFRGVLC